MGGSSSFKMCLNFQISVDPLPVEFYFIITEGPSVTAVMDGEGSPRIDRARLTASSMESAGIKCMSSTIFLGASLTKITG